MAIEKISKDNQTASSELRDESSSEKNDLKKESIKATNINKGSSKNEPKSIIDNANKYFLIKILSPEITNNEEKKRKHKDELINIVKLFLFFQLSIVVFLLLGVLVMVFIFHGNGNDLDLNYLNTIIKFISIYITSVVVELIAMLKYIVSNVFDTSITGLVELYKDEKKEG